MRVTNTTPKPPQNYTLEVNQRELDLIKAALDMVGTPTHDDLGFKLVTSLPEDTVAEMDALYCDISDEHCWDDPLEEIGVVTEDGELVDGPQEGAD